MVCATLILADHYAPGAWLISSDGRPDEWAPALDFIAEVTGKHMAIPEAVKVAA